MGRIEDRLSVLEGELRRVRELADQAAERPPGHGPVRNPRLAKTFHQDGVGYPTAPCTVYPIVFLDSTYTQTAGDQTPTDTARQAHAGALALYRGEDYLQEGTVVVVGWDNRCWWIIGLGAGAGGVLFGKLDGVLNQGSSATMSIWAGDPLADSGENVTVYDWFLELAGSLAAGTKCKTDFYSGKRYVTAAECPAA